MTTEIREFMKGGANVHVKAHYRVHNGKLIYIHDHDKMGSPVGTEAQLHERVQHAKNAAHLMAIDPEDRDAVLKHASQLGLKPEVKYQGGKIRDHEGNVKAHGFHYVKFDSEDDAKKVHAALAGQQQGEAAQSEEKPASPVIKEYPGTGPQEGQTLRVAKLNNGKFSVTMKDDDSGEVHPSAKIVDTEEEAHAYAEAVAAGKDPAKVKHPNDAVKQAESKLQGFISIGHPVAIQDAIKGSSSVSPEKGLELVDQGLGYAQAAVDAAEAYQDATGHKASNAETYHEVVAKLNTWKAQLQEKVKQQAEPKPAVDEAYTKKAHAAAEASGAAHESTKQQLAAKQEGKHAPEFASAAMEGHKQSMAAHAKARNAHLDAGDAAPTPELKAYHNQKASEHESHTKVHHEAAKMHEAQHKKNAALMHYTAENAKAGEASKTANEKPFDLGDHDDHGAAASAHEEAAKAQTGMIQHALNVGPEGEAKANEHAAKATEHQSKAAYHKLAQDANMKSGMATEGPDSKVKEVPSLHEAAAEAHKKAAEHAASLSGYHPAESYHSEKAQQHTDKAAQLKSIADLDAAEAEAAKASEATKKFKPYHDGHDSKGHLEAAAAHETASAAHAKAENPQTAKHHADWAEHHKTWAKQAAEKEQAQPESANPWKGQDHGASAKKGVDAINAGDYVQAAQHFKHAAVVAHHNGETEAAKKFADAAKVAMSKAKPVQKAIAPQALLVGVQDAARQLHQERHQVRHFGKALKDLPSSGRLHEACMKATAAGITDVDDILAHALGGKKMAAPYLAFLAEASR